MTRKPKRKILYYTNKIQNGYQLVCLFTERKKYLDKLKVGNVARTCQHQKFYKVNLKNVLFVFLVIKCENGVGKWFNDYPLKFFIFSLS